MLNIHIKNALRSITRNRTSAFINITGLALGICAFIFLIQYISLEQSVNRFHSNAKNIYRLINQDVQGKTWPETEPGWSALFSRNFSSVTNVCRFDEETGSTVISRPANPDKSFSEQGTGYADGDFFEFFSFPLVSGKASSLHEPNTMFCSVSTAKKYFGDLDPVGQTLIINNQFGRTLYTVEGVFADMKDNSDIRFNMLFSLETLKNPANLNGNDWARLDNLNTQYLNTYLALGSKTDVPALEKQLIEFRRSHKPQKDGVQFRLQPISHMHLGSSVSDSYPIYGSLKYVYMLGGITILILLIAWFNYVNLSTANSISRAHEVGVRKVIGAGRTDLVLQFLTESLLTNLMAFVLAIILVSLLQPFYNRLVDKTLDWGTITSSGTWFYGLLLLLAGSLLSGAYTAFNLSRYNPVETLKGKINHSAGGLMLRKALVVSQFFISILLIIATVVIYRQLEFLQNKKLGLNPSQLLVIKGPQVGRDSTFTSRKAAFEQALTSNLFISSFCASGSIPSGNYNFITSGFTRPEPAPGDELNPYAFAIIDDRYLSTYQIPLVAGRNFTETETAVRWNDNSKVLMNETAVKQLGFTNLRDILTTKITWHKRKLDVIGIVKDYNHTGAGKAIDPVIFYPQNNSTYYTLRLSPDQLEKKISDLQQIYKADFGGNPFEYFFVDEQFNKLYASEKRYGQVFTAASAWAILIACLGLFGLSTFSVRSRIKEIGIRKVLGASEGMIFTLLSRDFLLLVAIAFLLSVPAGWWAMNRWLSDFANRIDLDWWVFVAAGATAFSIALVTISFRAIQASRSNPVQSLRTE